MFLKEWEVNGSQPSVNTVTSDRTAFRYQTLLSILGTATKHLVLILLALVKVRLHPSAIYDNQVTCQLSCATANYNCVPIFLTPYFICKISSGVKPKTKVQTSKMFETRSLKCWFLLLGEHHTLKTFEKRGAANKIKTLDCWLYSLD